jgi:dTDP-4-dehydrorhamnose reductase
MSRILLLGQGGQVGWELQRALRPLGTLIGLDFNTPGPAEAPDLKADFSQPEQVAAIVRAVKPDVIVNSAAHTAVDKAESEPELARLLNATTPGVIAQEAAKLGALLVHYSTDYVFDGSGSAPRDETAPTAPLSVYGQTKLEGEQAIQASGCQHLILRTSWVYAARGGNFAKTMLRLAAERDQLSVINDQFGAPTGADLLADVTAHAIRATLAKPQLAGLYHCIAGGETNWHAYASFVIEWARAQGGVNGLPIKVAADQILAVPTTAYPTPARRPLNSRLSTQRLQQAFGLALPHWQVGVERMLTEIHGK